MLRSLIAACFMMLVLFSCSSSKEARGYKKNINGNWTLQTIVTEGITGKIRAQVLDEADFNCFIGSTWNFNMNNSLGSYTINKNGNECASLKRNIRWSLFEQTGTAPMLQYKRVDDKYKDMEEGKAGYRFTIISVDDREMKLRNDIVFEGKNAAFIYNFVRL